ncbi:transmembrane protein 179B, partial [Tamandua tetradactyla]|uniref:transmembrane protein 179B n=1 Tax=Tamandua tetradactyla TaxID=48850 RepID=UPI0040548EB6
FRIQQLLSTGLLWWQLPLYGVATLNGSKLVLSCPSVCYFVAGATGFSALCCLLLLFWVCSSCIQDFHRCCLPLWAGGRSGKSPISTIRLLSPACRGPIGLRIAISAIAIFLVLVSSGILRYSTSSFCNSIVSLSSTISCPEAQKIPWTTPGTTLQFYLSLHNAETSSWVNLVLWCVILVLQILQRRFEVYQPLQSSNPEWSSETDAL